MILMKTPAFWLPRSRRKISKSFATPGSHFRRNRQMNKSLRNQTEIQELQYEQSSGFTEGAETNEETSTPVTNPDTMLSTIVLLLACLALAALAHVIV